MKIVDWSLSFAGDISFSGWDLRACGGLWLDRPQKSLLLGYNKRYHNCNSDIHRQKWSLSFSFCHLDSNESASYMPHWSHKPPVRYDSLVRWVLRLSGPAPHWSYPLAIHPIGPTFHWSYHLQSLCPSWLTPHSLVLQIGPTRHMTHWSCELLVLRPNSPTIHRTYKSYPICCAGHNE